jgi:hypothetical protein
MSRFNTRLLAILGVSLALLGMLSMTAGAAPSGNAEAKAACENGGYVNYTDADGNPFKNEGQCIKYAAQGNTPVPVVTEDPAVTRCKQEAVQAGINPAGYNIITGTDEGFNEELTPTTGPDLICGFGGSDYVLTLDADDIFLGGDGSDSVNLLYGIFIGGGSYDHTNQVYGTYYGSVGDDTASEVHSGGTFNGGDGNDAVFSLHEGGTFNGGVGDDAVYYSDGGTFNQD